MDSVLLYILGILVVAVGLAISIGLHEVGHLVPAKRFGVKVGQFMIGFGPTLWSRRRGETEYGIKALPLGGYISMTGMFPPAREGERARTAGTGFLNTMVQDARDSSASQIEPGEEHRTFYRLATWKRVVIMLGGPTMNVLIAIVLYGVVLCGFGVPVASTTVGRVDACVIPATSTQTECAEGDAASPAAAAGILPGDRLVELEGRAVESWADATAVIRDAPGTALELVVERDGEDVPLELTPLATERYVLDERGGEVEGADGEPLVEEVGFVGIGAATEVVRQPVTEVLPAVGDNVVRVGGIILTLPQRLVQVAQAAFGDEERDPNGPISVVGVGRLAGEITSLDELSIADRMASLIQMVAALNVALFVFNLIPLLPLDGGHVAGALWESLRRRLAKLFKRPDPGPVDTAKLIPVTLTVVAVLGISSALLIYADLVNPVSLF
ncbi:M50 family metallopeptidase [Homoserinibacter sp. YIM 151385]|uniref:M50 family metallopeptidase n=1 Tax=Homoserinibacter sp. YIM 151385 TaxID=2985506 RepID=UPI0022F10805|nr:site-2 protease family protein [Homoserinibacter sp. YIM 151385]WBU38325.1 site-2 protease family protein [Homoserinibacter sp. YIM 151385]